MAISRIKTTVEYEDGTTTEVTTDQRDHVACELHLRCGFPTALEEKTFQAFRFITWHALKRTGQTTDTLQAWEAKAVGVEPVPDGDAPLGGSQEASDET